MSGLGVMRNFTLKKIHCTTTPWKSSVLNRRRKKDIECSLGLRGREGCYVKGAPWRLPWVGKTHGPTWGGVHAGMGYTRLGGEGGCLGETHAFPCKSIIHLLAPAIHVLTPDSGTPTNQSSCLDFRGKKVGLLVSRTALGGRTSFPVDRM